MAVTKKFSSKIAANGQVVVPLELRALLAIHGGDSIIFIAEQDDTGMVKVSLRKPVPSFKKMVGVCSDLSGTPLKKILKAIDDEDMV